MVCQDVLAVCRGTLLELRGMCLQEGRYFLEEQFAQVFLIHDVDQVDQVDLLVATI